MVVLNNVSAKIYLRTEHLTLGTPLSPPQLVTPLCRDLFVVHSRVLSSSTVNTSLSLSLSLQATGPGDRRPNNKSSS